MRATSSAQIRAARHPGPWRLEAAWLRTRSAVRCGVFLLEMIPARRRPIDWVTRAPLVERLSVGTRGGAIDVDLHRPPSPGPHPGVVVSFGVNPTGGMDPRVTQMGNALARAGFATLLYWPPSARDMTIELDDIADLASAFEVLHDQPYVDPDRCGFVGICVGGAMALIAAADPGIRGRVSFVCAYAPYSSMRTLAIDIASGTRSLGDLREPWEVDPLTWTAYVRTVTGWLRPSESQRLRGAFEGCVTWNDGKTSVLHAPAGPVQASELSGNGRAALRLLLAGPTEVEGALDELPPPAQALLTALSPIQYVQDLLARVVLLHDRHDHVIPVGESRRLWSELAGRNGATYAELGLRHLRMPQGISPLRIIRELWRAYRGWYPLFHATASAPQRRST